MISSPLIKTKKDPNIDPASPVTKKNKMRASSYNPFPSYSIPFPVPKFKRSSSTNKSS